MLRQYAASKQEGGMGGRFAPVARVHPVADCHKTPSKRMHHEAANFSFIHNQRKHGRGIRDVAWEDPKPTAPAALWGGINCLRQPHPPLDPSRTSQPQELHMYECHVVFSESYSVPVLYFRAWADDGGMDPEHRLGRVPGPGSVAGLWCVFVVYGVALRQGSGLG